MPFSLLLVSSFGPSLLNFRGHLLRQALQSGFDQVVVLSPECDRDHPSLDILRSWGVDVRFFPLQRTGLNPFHDLYTIYKLYRVISDISPSHLVAYTIKLFFIVDLLLICSNISFAVIPDTYVPMITGLEAFFL